MTISKGVADDAMLDRLREGKVIQIAPQGVSMLPFIREDVDSVKLRRQETLHIGDIVCSEAGIVKQEGLRCLTVKHS